MSLGSRLFRFRGNAPYLLANMNESYKADLAVFRQESIKKSHGPKTQRVLCVASSGETALALCSNPSAQTVTACDISGAQIHFSELRRHALIHLDTPEFLILNGVADSDYERESQTRERIGLFQKVAGKLPQSSQDFWSALRDSAVAFGLMHTGKLEVVNSTLREELLQKGYDFPLERFHDYAKEEAFWRIVSKPFETYNFTRALNLDLVLPPEAFEAAMKIYNPNVFVDGLKRMHKLNVDMRKNYFASILLNGTHAFGAAGDAGFPLIFTQKGRDALLSNGIGTDRLVFKTKSIFDVAAEEKGLNFVTLSNIFDMFPPPMIPKVLKIVQRSMASEGLLVVRKGNPGSLRPDIEASGFEIDSELTKLAIESEESLFLGKYGGGDTIFVARKKEVLDKE